MDEVTELEYIKAMIEYAKDDVRQDYLRVTGALALATLFITQIPLAALHELSRWPTLALFAGLGCLVGAAGAYWYYINKTHQARLKIAEQLKDCNVKQARVELVENVFDKTWLKNLYWAGTALFASGVVFLGIVLWVLVA